MKRHSLFAIVVALAAMLIVPSIASAEHRFGTDRGSRYYRGYEGGRSRSHWNVSVGFGSGGYYRSGYSHVGVSFGRSPTYYRGGYSRHYPRYYSAPAYCPPPVVYAPSPRVVYAAPAYYPPPPVVYYAPRPVYTSSYYYSSGGYYCGR
jgi:hypothetical protein